MALTPEEKKITDLLRKGEYKEARETLAIFIENEPDNVALQILLARCNLALRNIQEAEKIYGNLSKTSDKKLVPEKSEANLVLGKARQAIDDLERYMSQHPVNAEEFFLLSLMAYKNGNIFKTIDFMRKAVERDLEWEDELPINILVEYVLSLAEYHDFENIYLDVCEEIDEGHDQTNNRWFALNMPVYDYSTSNENTETRAYMLLIHIYPDAPAKYLNEGQQKLESILMDLAASQTDARFGLEAMKLLKEDNTKELAKLVLAMLLEHLAQFSSLLGIDKEFVKKSQLQDLVKLLPYRLAVIAMTLFTITHPLETMEPKKNDPKMTAGLIAACLTSFYLEIEKFKSSGTK